MSDEPTPDSSGPETGEREINEIEAAAREAKRAREAADASTRDREQGNWPIVPIAIGVGSAALAAALMYAGRPRKKR